MDSFSNLTFSSFFFLDLPIYHTLKACIAPKSLLLVTKRWEILIPVVKAAKQPFILILAMNKWTETRLKYVQTQWSTSQIKKE